MNHKRHRPRSQRAGCWCKFGKKMGVRALRGGARTMLVRGADVRLRERARDIYE